jgi:hypothetical protein
MSRSALVWRISFSQEQIWDGAAHHDYRAPIRTQDLAKLDQHGVHGAYAAIVVILGGQVLCYGLSFHPIALFHQTDRYLITRRS